MLTIDSSGLVALADPTDAGHEPAVAALAADRGPHIIPTAIFSEAAYVLERRAGGYAIRRLLDDLIAGVFLADCGEDDLPRVRELVTRYDDLSLGWSDAAVIACGERNGGRILTLDRRDFEVVARGEGTVTLLP